MTTYPTREAGSWPPADGFTRIEPGNNYRGIPDGCHTGGAYLSPDQREVWKPLICLWPTTTGYRDGPTREIECLEAGADLKSFPANWRVEQAAGKPWIVRPRAIVVKGTEDARSYLEIEHVVQIERDIRELNRRGWAVHDNLSIAIWRGQRFVLDLSTANTCKVGWDDDQDHVMRWLKECVDIPWLSYLRHEGRRVQVPFSKRFEGRHEWAIKEIVEQGYIHIYASRNRPMDSIWAPREWYYLPGNEKDAQEARVHTWVLTKEPISDEKIASYELQWAWSPWGENLT